MMYLRRLRLHHVHAELAAHSPDSVTVTMVAGRWGFVHLGRFAGQYRQLFGETPSETLRTHGCATIIKHFQPSLPALRMIEPRGLGSLPSPESSGHLWSVLGR
jgi:AraC-like DNA-binding protein